MTTAQARLDVVAGNTTGTSIFVDDELLIGRLVEGAGRLADDEEISRTHARVRIDDAGRCMIEDLGSTNGTFVNGMRISSERELVEGDTIELGSTTMVVRDLPHPVAEQDDRTLLERPLPPGFDPSPPPPAVVGTPLGDPLASAPMVEPVTPARPSVPAGEPPAPFEESVAAGEPPAAVEPASVSEPFSSTESSAGQGEPSAEGDALVSDTVEQPPAISADSVRSARKLALRLELDLDAGEAELWLDDASEPVRLVHEAGAWRPAGQQPDSGPPRTGNEPF